MEKEKNLLYNQLRDLEWRLDQESKVKHLIILSADWIWAYCNLTDTHLCTYKKKHMLHKSLAFCVI